jgi:glycine betaine catabolism A
LKDAQGTASMNSFLKAAEVGTGGGQTLPGRYYTSRDIFDQEQEKIFLRYWLCAGREEHVSAAGDFLVRSVDSESVLVIRDAAGEVRAHHNVCRHRGARLCAAPSGRFHRTIQCPYHAWTYGLDGQLLGAPNMEDAAAFQKHGYPLHPVQVAVWEGFIFLSLTRPPASFQEAFSPLWNKFARYNLPQLRRQRRIEYDVKANWKLIFENYSECYHCPTVHPELVKLSPADSGANDLVRGMFLGGFMEIVRPGGSLTSSGRSCSIPVGELSAEDRQRVYYYAIFPNMLLSLHHDYVMVHTLWPVSPQRTLIECDWLFHAEAAMHPEFDPDDGVGFWDRTNRQDWHICELTQQGVSSRAYTPGPFAPRDSISAAFDRTYLEALADSPQGRTQESQSGAGEAI